YRGNHLLMGVGADLQRGDEVGRQLPHVGAARAIQAVGVVFDRVLLPAVVDALLARVGPRERRLDAVRRVVRKRQADGAGGRDRQQVGVTQPLVLDQLLDGLG